ncbi:MAG: hypothetical protein RL481_261 [Pseudomonadota bacterium]|jgi:hypothetical protein
MMDQFNGISPVEAALVATGFKDKVPEMKG